MRTRKAGSAISRDSPASNTNLGGTAREYVRSRDSVGARCANRSLPPSSSNERLRFYDRCARMQRLHVCPRTILCYAKILC
jgi:hypothetical protein